MTSAVNGLLFLTALFWIARYLAGADLATWWTLMYASSFLPLILSRSAVVEHTFNGLMALGTLCLVAYDVTYSRYAETGTGRRGPRPAVADHWLWLAAAALALGLAVLAKGPSGGAVPLVAFGAYKWVRRGVRLNPGHWIACGVLALAVALSWYFANYLLHGGAFLAEFARFMGLLFSKPLEGHSGPFYYHGAVALVGLFPWTPLLLLYALPQVRAAVVGDGLGRALAGLGVGWAGFVLIVFSIVRTKLPHYSSGMYVPLTLLAALALQGAVRSRGRIPAWAAAVIAVYGLAMAAGFAVLPYRLAEIAAANGAGLQPAPEVPALAFVPGALLGIGAIVGALLLGWGRTLTGVALLAAAMGAFVIGLWRVHLPLIAAYTQGPVIALMGEAYRNGGDLALYKNVSYAALFYGDSDIDMVGTYKFTGDTARLDTPGDAPLYVIAPRESVQQLLAEHPRLRPVSTLGGLAMYRLPAKGEAPQ
jgi:4-amino-4-deoxy-L-arabinose transferase-like glycosyltransferase